MVLDWPSSNLNKTCFDNGLNFNNYVMHLLIINQFLKLKIK